MSSGCLYYVRISRSKKFQIIEKINEKSNCAFKRLENNSYGDRRAALKTFTERKLNILSGKKTAAVVFTFKLIRIEFRVSSREVFSASYQKNRFHFLGEGTLTLKHSGAFICLFLGFNDDNTP